MQRPEIRKLSSPATRRIISSSTPNVAVHSRDGKEDVAPNTAQEAQLLSVSAAPPVSTANHQHHVKTSPVAPGGPHAAPRPAQVPHRAAHTPQHAVPTIPAAHAARTPQHASVPQIPQQASVPAALAVQTPQQASVPAAHAVQTQQHAVVPQKAAAPAARPPPPKSKDVDVEIRESKREVFLLHDEAVIHAFFHATAKFKIVARLGNWCGPCKQFAPILIHEIAPPPKVESMIKQMETKVRRTLLQSEKDQIYGQFQTDIQKLSLYTNEDMLVGIFESAVIPTQAQPDGRKMYMPFPHIPKIPSTTGFPTMVLFPGRSATDTTVSTPDNRVFIHTFSGHDRAVVPFFATIESKFPGTIQTASFDYLGAAARADIVHRVKNPPPPPQQPPSRVQPPTATNVTKAPPSNWPGSAPTPTTATNISAHPHHHHGHDTTRTKTGKRNYLLAAAAAVQIAPFRHEFTTQQLRDVLSSVPSAHQFATFEKSQLCTVMSVQSGIKKETFWKYQYMAEHEQIPAHATIKSLLSRLADEFAMPWIMEKSTEVIKSPMILITNRLSNYNQPVTITYDGSDCVTFLNQYLQILQSQNRASFSASSGGGGAASLPLPTSHAYRPTTSGFGSPNASSMGGSNYYANATHP